MSSPKLTPDEYGDLASIEDRVSALELRNASVSPASFISRDNATGATVVVSFKTAADTNDRLTVDASGRISWGPGGVAAADTNLYRNGVASLRTDGSFQVAGNTFTFGQSAATWTWEAANLMYVAGGNFAVGGYIQMRANTYNQEWRTGVNSLGGDTWEATYNNRASWAYVRAQAFLSVSSQDLKTDIRPIGKVLTKIMQLPLRRYFLADLADNPDVPDSGPEQIGVVVEEVAPLFPEVTGTDEDGVPNSVDYGRLSVLALAAVKELSVLVSAQADKITALTNRVALLEAAASPPAS